MILRDLFRSRIVEGAKLFVVLTAMAALPALVLGQANPRPKSEPAKPGAQLETKAAEIQALLNEVQKESKANSERLRLLNAEVELKSAEAAAPDAKLIKDIEARIAELNKQLQAMKAHREAAGAVFQIKPLEPRVNPVEGKVRIWVTDENDPTKPLNPNPAQLNPNPTRKIEMKLAPGAAVPPAWGQFFPGGGLAPGQSLPPQLGGQAKPSQYKVIGQDGKEIKDAKVIVIAEGKMSAPPSPYGPAGGVQFRLEESREKPGAPREQIERGMNFLKNAVVADQIIPLARATYKLPHEKAEALAGFLKANVKAPVLEFKFENEGVTITTLPEVQGTIVGLVRLMGK